MKRGQPPKRRTPLSRSSRLAPVNRERRAEAFARAYGSKERVEWVQWQPCVVCGHTPCQNAHTVSGGTGRKADANTIVPLCALHHGELHLTGTHTFQAVHRVDLAACAERTDAAWTDLQRQRGAA